MQSKQIVYMKVYYPILLICVPIMMGCESYTAKQLSLVETTIENNADSALLILNKLSTSKLNEEETAIFNLLYSQASYKLRISFDFDSLINHSIAYFEAQNDKYHLASAYFYKAMLLYDQNNKENAILFLKQSESIANEINNNLLKNKNYELLSLLNYKSKNYSTALTYSKLFLTSSIILNDSAIISRAYNTISIIYYNLNIKDSANYYRAKYMQIADKDSIETPYSYTNYANALIAKNKYDEAYIWLQKALELKPMANIYVMLGKVSQAKGDTSQARKHWETALTFNDTRFNQKSYALLATLATQRGDYREAIRLRNKADSLLYAYSKQVMQNQMLEIQKKYDKTLVEKELADKKVTWLVGTIIALVIIVILLLVVLYYLRRARMYRGIIDQNIQRINEAQQKISLLESSGTKYSHEIDILKEQIEKMRKASEVKLGIGKDIYETIVRKEKLTNFSKEREQHFIDYYAFTYPQDFINICMPYKSLTKRHTTYLILNHLSFNDKEAAELLCVSETTIRNYRLRLNKVKDSKDLRGL